MIEEAKNPGWQQIDSSQLTAVFLVKKIVFLQVLRYLVSEEVILLNILNSNFFLSEMCYYFSSNLFTGTILLSFRETVTNIL